MFYVFAGGTVRLIPPGITLGIHDMGLDPKHPNWPSEFFDAVERSTKARMHENIRFMGIDDQLLSQAFAIPNTSLGHLSRDDAARFGLDRREFGETVWHFSDMPTPTIKKAFFVRIRSEAPRYIDGLVKLSCDERPDAQYVLTFARDLLPSDPSALATEPRVSIRVGNKQFSLFRDQDSKFYRRSARLAPAALDGIVDAGTIVLPGTEFGGENGPTDDIRLIMDGFSAAYSRLQKACT